ncbi:MAG: FAD-dependent oxidoreductase, partial [Kofleriaceae bacterium]
DVALADGTIRVGAKKVITPAPRPEPARVVIVGAGAAGVAAAEALRDEGHRGTITLVSGEPSDPVDRPNLSKDFLAGNAPEEWVYLRTAAALQDRDITLAGVHATAIDPDARLVRLADNRDLPYDALLLATGAEAIRLPIDGALLPHVHVLRTLTDSRAIVAAATKDAHAVIIGASFIGLEAAASLRARGMAVTVVGPETIPLARVLGDEVGRFVQGIHESHGVTFQLGRKPTAITAEHVILDDGSELPAALVVIGVGVKPRLELASAAGLAIDKGIVVDAELRAAPAIWAAGDVARYPWHGSAVRIEHWQVAVRHGQTAARSMLDQPARADVPFFWTQHHDVTLGYVGHAETFAPPVIHGDLAKRDAHVVYCDGKAIKAVVTLGRDKLALDVEAAMERDDQAALAKLVD